MITPKVFVIEGILFLAGLVLHAFIWRWRRPKHQALALLLIFLAPLVVFMGEAGLITKNFPLIEIAAIGLLHISLMCAYIQTYPVLQALSPSLLILLLMGEVESEGLSENEILSRFRAKELLHDRIEDLADAHLIRESHGILELTRQGRILAFLFTSLRKILGLPAGLG